MIGAGSYGSISGGMATVIAVAQTAAPLAVGALRQGAGDYDPALWLLTGSALVAAAAVGRAGRSLTSRRAQTGAVAGR